MMRTVAGLLLCLCADPLFAQSSDIAHPISVECAHRDLVLITELDSARDAKAPVGQLVLASQMLLKARRYCQAGDEAKAFRIYDEAVAMLQDRPIWFRDTGD